MESIDHRPPQAPVVLTWIVRIVTGLAVVFLLVFLVGHAIEALTANPPPPGFQDFSEVVMFAFFPIGTFVGLIVGWKWRLIGGLTSLVSFIGFHAVSYISHSSGNWSLLIDALLLVGVLNLVIWFIFDRRKA